MIPDVERCMAAVHESGHAVVAHHFGLAVEQISVDDRGGPVAGRVGHVTLTGTCSWREHLVVLAAGAAASQMFFPEIPPRLHAAAGHADFVEIDEVVKGRYPEALRRSAYVAVHRSAETLVFGNAREIGRLASTLLRETDIPAGVA